MDSVVVTGKLLGDDLGSVLYSGGETRLEEVVVVRWEEDDDVAWWTAGAGGNCEEDAGRGRFPSPPRRGYMLPWRNYRTALRGSKPDHAAPPYKYFLTMNAYATFGLTFAIANLLNFELIKASFGCQYWRV